MAAGEVQISMQIGTAELVACLQIIGSSLCALCAFSRLFFYSEWFWLNTGLQIKGVMGGAGLILE
jgi:hypothetical protein